MEKRGVQVGQALRSFLASRPHLIPAGIAAVLLLGALGRWPYDYYVLLRWVTCGAGAWVAYCAYEAKHVWATWLFGLVALLFNPVVPVHLTREIWQPIDVVVAALFLTIGLALKTQAAPEQTQGG